MPETMTFPRKLLPLALLLLAACGLGEASPLDGGKWTAQPALSKLFIGAAFDLQGNWLCTNEGRYYRYDPIEKLWSDLGPGPNGGHGAGAPFNDRDGSILVVADDTLYRLAGDDTWTKLYPMPQLYSPSPDRMRAFGADGSFFIAGTDPGSLENYFIYRHDATEWKETFRDPPSISVPKALLNDDAGHVFVTFVDKTMYVSPTGDAVSLPWDCDGKKLYPYCSGEYRAVGTNADQELLFEDANAFYRAASPTSKPTLIAGSPSGFNIYNMVVFHEGAAFLVAKDVTGMTPWLFRLGSGDSEWKKIIEMPSFNAVLKVRADGAIFAYRPEGGLLWRLTS